MLQRLTEDLEYHELLDRAAKCENSLEQLCYVAAFTVSSYSTTVFRTSKPFNPLLGETFELDRLEENGYRSLCEQVKLLGNLDISGLGLIFPNVPGLTCHLPLPFRTSNTGYLCLFICSCGCKNVKGECGLFVSLYRQCLYTSFSFEPMISFRLVIIPLQRRTMLSPKMVGHCVRRSKSPANSEANTSPLCPSVRLPHYKIWSIKIERFLW